MIGALAGLLGGTWHLIGTALRARAVGDGRAVAAMVALPLSWAGPLACAWGVLQLQPGSAWAVIPGLLLARLLLLRPLADRVGGAPWTP